jgi:hypothetical protein
VGGLATYYLFGNVYMTQNLGGDIFRGQERTEDQTHPFYVLFMNAPDSLRAVFRNPLFRYVLKTGGDFKSVKTYYVGEYGRKVSLGNPGGNNQTYSGRVSPVQKEVIGLAPDPTSDNFLRDLGAKQILYNLPDRPLVGISQTLAELKREGLPRTRALASFRSYSPRKAGEDYLTWQFGFRPVIQDIYALADSIDTADKQWRSYVNGANKLQRRHYEFPVEQSTKTEAVATGGSLYPILPGSLASGQTAQVYRTRTTVTKRRFSAAYAYTLPPGSESTILFVRKAQQYRKQYGLNVDPSLLWELTPWSWLIDWFLPIGDFIQSVSSLILGNTALPWAFISEHTVITDTYERPGCVLSNGQSPGSLQVVTDYKRRLAASPFGFGIAWKDLSSKQLAILAAIGITR